MVERIKTIDDDKITAIQSAKILRMAPEGLKSGLRNGKFSYFGEAFKTEDDSVNWYYYINPNRFLEYTGMAAARGVDLPEVKTYLEEKAKEPSRPENLSPLEKERMEKEIKKLKTENKKLTDALNRILEEASQFETD